MQRNMKRTITVVTILISVLLLVSPVVLAKVFVKIDDEGLKSVHIRADIVEENGQEHGPKHGRIQAMIREITNEVYSYKFMLDLRKATPSAQYSICLWADLPEEEVIITIYGDLAEGYWYYIELLAISLGIDTHHPEGKIEPDGVIETSVGALVGVLGLTGETIKQDTGMTFTTDEHGSFKHIKEGVITEDNAMEYALDLAWPFIKGYLASLIPWIELPPEIDFADLGVTGLWIHEGDYSISGGIRFVNTEDENDVYCTETVTIDRHWNDLIWDRGV